MNALKTQSGHVRAGRPGAMTTAMRAVQWKPSGPKVLRIGVVRNEAIVEERILRRRESVTIGSSEKSHFVIADANVARFELFQRVGNDYVLNFTEQMTGRVGEPGSVRDLAQLRQSGGARNVGTHHQIKLNDNARGKVAIGGTALLFQLVPAPAPQARPQLPAAARAGWVRSVDWLFTAFMVFSFMSAFGFIVYLESYDAPIDRGLAAIPDAIAEILFIEPPPPEEVKPDPLATANDPVTPDPSDAKPDHKPSDRARPTPNNDAQHAPVDADAVARLTKQAAQQAEALIVGALSADADGVLAEVLAAGTVIGKAEDILAVATGVGMALSASGGDLRSRNVGDNGSGRSDGLGSLIRAGSSDATQARNEQRAITERPVRGETKLALGGDIGGTGDFDAATVVNLIKIRMGAIKACYERSLRNNPTLAGKVTVEFTIVPAGTITGARIAANTTGDDTVAQCVTTTINSLRFKPGPQGGNVTYAYPFVFAPTE